MRTIPDETWARLDPRAGALSRRDRRRVRAAVAVVVALGVSAGAVWWSGLVEPRLNGEPTSWSSAGGSGPRVFTLNTMVSNDSPRSERLLRVGAPVAGLEVLPVPGLPTDLPAGDGIELAITYRVTDCAAVPKSDQRIPVVVERPWGTMTAELEAPPVTSDDAPASYSYSGPDPYAVPWHWQSARRVCLRSQG